MEEGPGKGRGNGMKEGWKCPVCGVGNSPKQMVCGNCAPAKEDNLLKKLQEKWDREKPSIPITVPSYPTYPDPTHPTYPPWWWYQTWCGNTTSCLTSVGW